MLILYVQRIRFTKQEAASASRGRRRIDRTPMRPSRSPSFRKLGTAIFGWEFAIARGSSHLHREQYKRAGWKSPSPLGLSNGAD
jgi:hypothetical protein